MSPTILLLDYEPRTVLRVTEALTPLGCEVVTAKDVDAAVVACATVEPRAVLITSVLPRLKVEDAITQLRARAGLRNTPFIVLMSGYSGHDSAADALRLGAQDIVPKPFSNEDLLARVKNTMKASHGDSGMGSNTRADVLDALRRSAGMTPDRGTVTSEDLFGDLIEDNEPTPADTQRIAIRPVEVNPALVQPVGSRKSPSGPGVPATPAVEAAATQRLVIPHPPAVHPTQPDTAVERALESTYADMREAGKARAVREDTGGASVDQLLSQTLSGLALKVPARPTPEPAAAPEPAPVAAVHPAVARSHEAAPAQAQAQAQAGAAGGTPFGQYELQEVIATGGMAEVWKARMRGVEGFQKIVAIKRILPHLTENDEFVTMFIDEAKLAAQLQHPNIIHIYDLGKLERSYYIAMEYIDGKDLRTILRSLEDKGGRMPLGLALFIGARLAAALDYAHRKRDLQGQAMALVHRDVSPQNVLISYDGDIKLCDFGIAKAASKASHTRAGALKGKLQYMSPEQAWGKDIDQRSDIFSLGLVFYEMLTGRKAFAGDSELSILEQVRAPQLTPPREMDPSTPPEVERVVLKALQTDREDRYQTAADMARELANILQSLRPAPGASELGSFLSDLVGRERQAPATSAPPVRPGVTATPLPTPKPMPASVSVRTPGPKPKGPKPQPKPAKPAPKPQTKPQVEVEEEVPEISQILEEKRRIPTAILIGGGIAAVALVAAVLFMTGDKKSATQTTPEMIEMARQTAQAEVARQESQLRERLTRESGGQAAADQASAAVPTAAGAVSQPRVPLAPTVAPRGTTAPALRPTTPAAAPTQAPAQALAQATAGLPAVVPTPAPPPAEIAVPVATRAPLAAALPSVHQGDLVEMSADVTPPQLLSNPRPKFPRVAQWQGSKGGPVILKVLVDENGSVVDAQVLRAPAPDYGFSRAALDAVKQWRFKPATTAGVRVKVHTTQTIVFAP